MATATIGFVSVNGRVEPEAIAGAIAANAHSRVGQFVGCTFDWFADQGAGAHTGSEMRARHERAPLHGRV